MTTSDFVFWILSLTLCCFLSGCEEKLKPAISSSRLGQNIPTQESWNAMITFTDSGRTTAILRAGHISIFSDQQLTLLDSNVVVDFFDENGNHSSILTAKRGRVDDATHNLEARENVIVTSDSGTVLKSEELYWLNAAQKIHTPAFVTITSATEEIRGYGLESDQSLTHYTIVKVTGQAEIDE